MAKLSTAVNGKNKTNTSITSSLKGGDKVIGSGGKIVGCNLGIRINPDEQKAITFISDAYIEGGYKVVKTITERDNIDCCYRKQGMRVVVVGEDLSFKEYRLLSTDCTQNVWEEIIVDVDVDESEVGLLQDYSEIGENISTQMLLNLAFKRLILQLGVEIEGIEVPTKTSDLLNDGEDGVKPFLTEVDIVDVPTNTSELVNDGQDGVHPFITLEDIPPSTNVTNTSELVNDGEDGVHPYITAEDIPEIGVVSATTTGIVNNISLQELGGVDKKINGVIVGKGKGTNNSDNTAIGVSVLQKNTTGTNNTGAGTSSLEDNTTGKFNAAFGDYSLYSNTTGIWNSTFGSAAMPENTTGSYNTAMGTALYHNKTGSNNVGIGIGSGYANETGFGNVYVGRGTAYENGVGNYNVGIGYFALSTNTGGYFSGGSTINYTNNVVLGSRVVPSANMSDTLAIDNKGATATLVADALLYGGFSLANRFLNIGGKLSVTPTHMPVADGTFTKNIVAKPNGTFGWEEKEDLKTAQIKITTTTGFTTETKEAVTNLTQNGKNILIDHGTNNIVITTDINSPSTFIATYIKLGTGTVTFTAGAGTTIQQVDGTNTLGNIGYQRCALVRNGNEFILYISYA